VLQDYRSQDELVNLADCETYHSDRSWTIGAKRSGSGRCSRLRGVDNLHQVKSSIIRCDAAIRSSEGDELNNYSWAANVELAPWHDCRVGQDDDADDTTSFFTCSQGPFENIQESLAALDSAVMTLQRCLGNARIVKEIPTSHRNAKRYMVTGTEKDPSVKLMQFPTSLRLTVRAPGQ
jgi:hypothetical protein